MKYTSDIISKHGYTSPNYISIHTYTTFNKDFPAFRVIFVVKVDSNCLTQSLNWMRKLEKIT